MTNRTAEAGGDLLARLRRAPGALARTYIAPERRVLYISVNKNACTSLKWMMADLAGEDLSAFSSGLMPFVSDDEAVHDPRQWKVARPLTKAMKRRTWAEIHPDNGWFVFGVVRDPRLRFFSAWQNKILMENPVTTQWRSEPWFPRHPVTEQTIIEDFARFTEFMEQNPGHKLRAKDGHFRSQVTMLMQHVVPYSRIYEISEIGQLRADLSAHLKAVGRPRELYLPRANHTPLRARGALFDNGVRESIERMYADDFEQLGDLWDFTPTMNAPAWTPEALAEVDLVASLSHRMGDLRAIAIHERRRAVAAEDELRRLRSDASTRRTLRDVARRVRSRLAR